MSVVRSQGFGCQRRGRVSRPFSPICGILQGSRRLCWTGGQLEELGGSCCSPAVRRGRICSHAQLVLLACSCPTPLGEKWGCVGITTHFWVPCGCDGVPAHARPVSALPVAVPRSAHSPSAGLSRSLSHGCFGCPCLSFSLPISSPTAAGGFGGSADAGLEAAWLSDRDAWVGEASLSAH